MVTGGGVAGRFRIEERFFVERLKKVTVGAGTVLVGASDWGVGPVILVEELGVLWWWWWWLRWWQFSGLVTG